MEFPEDIKDKKAYLVYKKLEQHPIVNEDKMLEASDGSIINLAWFPHLLSQKIEHLPIDEQEDVLALKDLYYKISNNLTIQKRLAFGFEPGVKGSLLDMKRTEIIELYGRLFTGPEILKEINKTWGIKFNSVRMLDDFRKKHADEIEEARERYKASYVDVRLGIKRSRLDEYMYLYTKQKEKYEETNSNDSYRLLLQTLEQVRKESEGDRLTINGQIDLKYEANIQAHLRDEIFKTLNIKEIILGRVAARMGVNPIKLIHSLNQSFYKKYSNVLGDMDTEESDGGITFPSQMGYDFERIGKVQKMLDKNADDAVLEDVKDNEDKSAEDALDVKKKLLAKLRAKQDKIKKGTAQINAATEIKKSKKKIVIKKPKNK